MGRDIVGDASGYQAEPGPAAGTHHDEADVVLVGSFLDRLPGRRSLGGHGLRPESGGLGQRGSVHGGLLGGLADVVGACRVELRLGLRDKPDLERTPDGEDNRVAPGWQLMAGLGDRGLGQVRAVIGEQHRSAPGTAVPLQMRMNCE
jgi:hypothetical protein